MENEHSEKLRPHAPQMSTDDSRRPRKPAPAQKHQGHRRNVPKLLFSIAPPSPVSASPSPGAIAPATTSPSTTAMMKMAGKAGSSAPLRNDKSIRWGAKCVCSDGKSPRVLAGSADRAIMDLSSIASPGLQQAEVQLESAANGLPQAGTGLADGGQPRLG